MLSAKCAGFERRDLIAEYEGRVVAGAPLLLELDKDGDIAVVTRLAAEEGAEHHGLHGWTRGKAVSWGRGNHCPT